MKKSVLVNPPSGGYILKVVNVFDKPSKSGKPMLSFMLDIAEGEFKDVFTRKYNESQNWYLNHYFVYDSIEQIARFKGLLKAFSKSNPKFFNREDLLGLSFNEKKLINLQIGGVLREEEYIKNGDIRIGIKVFYLCSTETIRAKQYKVPDIKRIENQIPEYSNPSNYEDEGLPF